MHDIQSFFCLIDLKDKIKLSKIKGKKDKIFFKGPFSKFVNKSNNSIIKLFKFLRRCFIIKAAIPVPPPKPAKTGIFFMKVTE